LAVELAELADCDVLESDMEAARWGECQWDTKLFAAWFSTLYQSWLT
jgi:hypothetical protein